MTKKSLTAAAALSLAVAALPAMALNTRAAKASKSERGQANQQLRAYDRNGDGIITRDEFPGDAATFDRMDRNHDGVLSEADRAYGRNGNGRGNGNGQQMRHRGMDTNGDGVITRDEWRGNDTSFRQHDRNGDGVLSGDELRGNGNGNGKSNRAERGERD